MVGIVQDITERHKSEEQLRLQSAALNAADNLAFGKGLSDIDEPYDLVRELRMSGALPYLVNVVTDPSDVYPRSVPSDAATCRIRYVYPSPAVSLCRPITATQPTHRYAAVTTVHEVCGD